jgi:hypothetical protein
MRCVTHSRTKKRRRPRADRNTSRSPPLRWDGVPWPLRHPPPQLRRDAPARSLGLRVPPPWPTSERRGRLASGNHATLGPIQPRSLNRPVGNAEGSPIYSCLPVYPRLGSTPITPELQGCRSRPASPVAERAASSRYANRRVARVISAVRCGTVRCGALTHRGASAYTCPRA